MCGDCKIKDTVAAFLTSRSAVFRRCVVVVHGYYNGTELVYAIYIPVLVGFLFVYHLRRSFTAMLAGYKGLTSRVDEATILSAMFSTTAANAPMPAVSVEMTPTQQQQQGGQQQQPPPLRAGARGSATLSPVCEEEMMTILEHRSGYDEAESSTTDDTARLLPFEHSMYGVYGVYGGGGGNTEETTQPRVLPLPTIWECVKNAFTLAPS